MYGRQVVRPANHARDPTISSAASCRSTRSTVSWWRHCCNVAVKVISTRPRARLISWRLCRPIPALYYQDALLRMRALLARARGEDSTYRDSRDRYRAMATSLGFEGHMKWAEAMP